MKGAAAFASNSMPKTISVLTAHSQDQYDRLSKVGEKKKKGSRHGPVRHMGVYSGPPRPTNCRKCGRWLKTIAGRDEHESNCKPRRLRQ